MTAPVNASMGETGAGGWYVCAGLFFDNGRGATHTNLEAWWSWEFDTEAEAKAQLAKCNEAHPSTWPREAFN